MELSVTTLPAPVSDLAVEVVEHKGIGHPDTMCDALAEALSLALCRHYQSRFGIIMHHNVDKALLVGGASRPAFRGGDILAPMDIYLSGRATRTVRGVTVPVDEIVAESARGWIARHLRAVDPDRHVRWHALVRPGSADLVDLYERFQHTGIRLANDTSIGVGYAPLSNLETVVLAAARELRRAACDAAMPEVGEDCKVMGVRHKDHLRLTVACAFIGRHLDSLSHYAERRAVLEKRVRGAAEQAAGRPVEVAMNTADDLERGQVFLTVLGTSAEAGDDGQVGRGNRIHGLITPHRPMTLEAAAGKNPVTHVGKLYGIVAREIAAAVVAGIPDIAEAHCTLVSRIGSPISDPQMAEVRVFLRSGRPASELAPAIESIVRDHLGRIDSIAARLLEGSLSVVGCKYAFTKEIDHAASPVHHCEHRRP